MKTKKTKPPGSVQRVVRRYRIVSKISTHVQISWQEKFVKDPEQFYWNAGPGKWRRRTRKVTREDLDKHYSRNPPNERGMP